MLRHHRRLLASPLHLWVTDRVEVVAGEPIEFELDWDAGNESLDLENMQKQWNIIRTVALSRSIGSRPFSAICLCNRAAAHQALGQITDAIADCSLAIALDGNYAKAVSRRATLHEMIWDYGQAASDLQRLISVLENQSGDKAKQPNSQGSSTSRTQELRYVYRHMPVMEEEAKKGIPLKFTLFCKTVDLRAATKKTGSLIWRIGHCRSNLDTQISNLRRVYCCSKWEYSICQSHGSNHRWDM